MKSQNPNIPVNDNNELTDLSILDLESLRGGIALFESPDDGGGWPPR